MAGILGDVRVLDLGRGLAASVAGLQLAEAGAEVVKVESPGDRRDTPGWRVWNRSKKSVVLDPGDFGALDRLLAASDVLLHDLTPREAEQAGLSDARLAACFPQLIVSGVTGWPPGHPDAERPARETLVLARLGVLDEQPGHRPGPVFLRMPYASFCAGWLSAIGVMARLIQRGRGRGVGPAHTSLVQGALGPMAMHWARAQRPSESFARGLSKETAIAIHPCADGGWIHVHYSPDKAPWMREALDALGPDGVVAANARWGRNHTAPNFGANREIFGTRPAREWLEHLWAHDVAAQLAAPFGDVYLDPQARENGYVVEVRDDLLGEVLQPGAAFGVRPPAGLRCSVRPLGADTEEVLATWAPRPGGGDAPAAAPPLEGVRILDFGAFLAGPFATMLLSDLGAEVVKVEPVAGDAMRYLDRTFCGCQRGKRSVALQLKDPRAAPVLAALVRWADAFHHNMRAPAARKLGLDYESLSALNPTIVGCHLSSYGPRGERADWPGFDQMFQAACGWEVEDGGTGNPPMWLRLGVCDHFGGLASAFALLLGLYHRDRTGEGQMTNASLMGATILTTSEAVVRPDGGVEGFLHLDAGQMGVAPYHSLYTCSDGWIAVAALSDAEQGGFRRVAGDAPAAFFGERKATEALSALEAAGVPAEAVRTDQQDVFLDDPAARASGLVSEAIHSTQGRLRQVGALWTLGEQRLRLDRAAPALGEHTCEVLAEVGIPPDETQRLAAEGVVVAA